MCHMKIRIPSVNANSILSALGSLENAIEFIDLTADDLEEKKTYGSMVKRCDELISKIKDLEIIADDLKVPVSSQYNYSHFQRDLEEDMGKRDKKYGLTYFDLTETEVSEAEKQVKELVNSLTQIREDLFRLIEKKYVLNKAAELLLKDSRLKQSFADVDIGEHEIKHSSSNLNLLTGVIEASEELKMKRMIFRISHGRALSTFYDFEMNIEEHLFTSTIKQRGFSLAKQLQFKNSSDLSANGFQGDGKRSKMKKKIFTIIFPGSDENYLQGKILKVCDIFQASRYGIPKTALIQSEENRIAQDISEKKRVLVDIEKNLMEMLEKRFVKKGNKAQYLLYKLYFIQEKMVYLTLSKCRIHETFIDGEVWIPKIMLELVQGVLRSIADEGRGDQLSANLFPIDDSNDDKARMPPTFIQSNEFLWAFQEIINTYGIPRYQEVNPAYFAVISFPFMFGIMYGDIGHGLILLISASYLCLCADSLKKMESSLIEMALKARYLLLLMGVFAFYSGLLYNELFSIPLEFPSCYSRSTRPPTPIKDPACTYYIGIDPQWINAGNELTFINSFKMKFSVIIGVIQMVFGIVLKGINAHYDEQQMTFWFSFLPQIILMSSIFGYMNVLIIIKWMTDWTGRTATAPDIKSMLMNVFLKFGEVAEPLWGTKNMQTVFHRFILAIFILSTLVMLIPKTVCEYLYAVKAFHKRHGTNLVANNNELLLNNINVDDNSNEEAEHASPPSFSDFFVNEIIETIEFVLGTVSNTASYLRLWALSLAHSQLSKVFLEQTILNELILSRFEGNLFFRSIIIFFLFFLWAYLTIGVLLFMDLMECFLHTLRLHWVEFQGKFFKADGYQFTPFSFSQSFQAEN